MDKAAKRKIRRLWQCQLLVSVGALAVLGFSVLQLRAVLENRHPQQPIWTLNLALSVEVLTNENSSDEEKTLAISEIQEIAQERQLILTEQWILAVNQDQTQVKVQSLDLARALTLGIALDLVRDQARVQDLGLNIALEKALNQDLARTLDRDLAQALDRDLTRAMKQAAALEQNLHQALGLDKNQALALNQEQAIVSTQNLAVALDQKQDLVWDQVLEQALMLKKSQTNILVSIVTIELEYTHKLKLQKGKDLENLLSSEPNRVRVLMQSGVLLGLSTFVLLALLVLLSRIQSSYALPSTAHLVAFLPEECVAELGTLQRRMKKAKASPWQIRRRLLEEIATLLWVFYIQVRLENLGLPWGDRKIDD